MVIRLHGRPVSGERTPVRRNVLDFAGYVERYVDPPGVRADACAAARPASRGSCEPWSPQAPAFNAACRRSTTCSRRGSTASSSNCSRVPRRLTSRLACATRAVSVVVRRPDSPLRCCARSTRSPPSDSTLGDRLVDHGPMNLEALAGGRILRGSGSRTRALATPQTPAPREPRAADDPR